MDSSISFEFQSAGWMESTGRLTISIGVLLGWIGDYLSRQPGLPRRVDQCHVGVLWDLLDQFHVHTEGSEVLTAVGPVTVAEASTVVDAAIGELVQGHSHALPQVQESRCSVYCPGMTGHGVAVSQHRLHGALLPPKHPKDNTQGAALGVASKAVVQ